MKDLVPALILYAALLTGAVFPFAILLFCSGHALGPWMAVSDPVPVRLDVIYTYAGEGVRNLYSRKLAEEFPQALFVFGDWPDMSQGKYIDGMDASRIVRIRGNDTHGETEALFRVLEKRAGGKADTLHVGLVTGPYHQRRVCYDARFLPHSALWRFHSLPVPYGYYGWDEKFFREWYRHAGLRNLMVFELNKMVYYNFKYWK